MVKVIDTTENQYTCPRGCGPLKYGRGLEVPGKVTHCKKCKGVFLTKEEIRKWEKKWGINKLRSNDLINLLNSLIIKDNCCPLIKLLLKLCRMLNVVPETKEDISDIILSNSKIFF